MPCLHLALGWTAAASKFLLASRTLPLREGGEAGHSSREKAEVNIGTSPIFLSTITIFSYLGGLTVTDTCASTIQLPWQQPPQALRLAPLSLLQPPTKVTRMPLFRPRSSRSQGLSSLLAPKRCQTLTAFHSSSPPVPAPTSRPRKRQHTLFRCRGRLSRFVVNLLFSLTPGFKQR